MNLIKIDREQYSVLFSLSKKTIIINGGMMNVQVTLLPEESLLLRIMDNSSEKVIWKYRIVTSRPEIKWLETLKYLEQDDNERNVEEYYPVMKEKIYVGV